MMIKKTIQAVLDLIYPPFCLLCQKSLTVNEGVCAKCIGQIQFICAMAHCENCFYPLLNTFENVRYCYNCRDEGYKLKQNYSLGLYSGVLKEMIHLFKYNNKESLKFTLSFLMIDFFNAHMLNQKFDIICYVPLSRKREKKRGYNQSELLAEALSNEFKIELLHDGLIKKNELPAQSSLKKKERIASVKGAFLLKDSLSVKNKKVLLLDDVFTTGSTLNECAHVLKKNKAAEVITFTLARGVL